MFSRLIKRCLASLCLAVTLAGTLFPATVYADITYDENSLNYSSQTGQYTIKYDDLTILTITPNGKSNADLTGYFQYAASLLEAEDLTLADPLEAYISKYKSLTTDPSTSTWSTLPVCMLISLYQAHNRTPISDLPDGAELTMNSIFSEIHNVFVDVIGNENYKIIKTIDYTTENLGIFSYMPNNVFRGDEFSQRAVICAAECLYIYQCIPSILLDVEADSQEYNTILISMARMEQAFSTASNETNGGENADITLMLDLFTAKDIKGFNRKSINSLYEALDDIGSAPTQSTGNIKVDYVSNINVGDSPLDLFYTINIPERNNIFTAYNRDSILNDVVVDDNYDNMLAVELDKWRKLNKSYDFNEYWSAAVYNMTQQYDVNTVNITNVGETLAEYQSFKSGDSLRGSTDYGTDASGNTAISASAVSMSEYIIEGMGYSTTYIPMRTSLYSVDVLSSYSDEFLENFYYKYGFFRKALFIDTSASSAMDYYVSGGRSSATTRVATLRDLLESDGKDVTLYIDSGFYNATDAKDLGTTYLSQRYSYLVNLKSTLDDYIEAEEALNLKGFDSFNYTFSRTLLQLLSKFPLMSQESKDAVQEALLDYDDPVEELQKQWEKEIKPYYINYVADAYNIDIEAYDDIKELRDSISAYLSVSNSIVVDDSFLKDGSYSTQYRTGIIATIGDTDSTDYRDIYSSRDLVSTTHQSTSNWLSSTNTISNFDNTYLTENNFDAIVMDSYSIGRYMSHDAVSTKVTMTDDEISQNIVSSIEVYNPMQSFAFVSLLYRDTDAMNLSSLLENAQPVFMASDDLCSVDAAGQWYRNSLLNYALVQNLPAMVQIDYNYACDIDAPLYMDVFGNILTSSGIVVIPAASNATLHTGAYKYSNLAVGLYSCYGKEYSVPIDLKGAFSVLSPYFTPDYASESYIVSNIALSLNGQSIKLNHINQYSQETAVTVQTVYKQAIREDNVTNYNWPAMVHIINEVLRGAPVEYIDSDEEGLGTVTGSSKSTIIAATKLEGLLDSLKGETSNTLMCIPDFTRMDGLEYWVALLVKLMLVILTGVVLIVIYRDGVSGQLGVRTILTCVSSGILTVSCIVLVPAVFQLTYYSANKMLLEDEAFRILMVNTEKYNLGTEIAMTGTRVPTSSDEFSIQLDWIDVPWYDEINELMFNYGLTNLQKQKLEAYQKNPTYYNNDVEIYNDGVYINVQTLFNSVKMDYSDNGSTQGLYLYSDNGSDQTTSFYSPYYVFLRVLTANVNEYNRGRTYYDETGTNYFGDSDYTYTTKYMAGNKLKTVGLCESYFTSDDFMVKDVDIMRLYQIYSSTAEDDSIVKDRHKQLDQHYDRALLFNDSQIEQFQASLWYNDLGDAQNLDKRVELMDEYARDFIAENRDLLGRVSDETFIKVMSLYMAVKYNRLFGITHASALEIYNLDSSDLLRLCLSTDEDAALTSPMSYSRYIATFGGESSVYAAAVLSIIMYAGSFIKPLCTVIVYISVFMSIFIFKVVMRKPSANLWGYFVTCLLLCITNFMHAILLKISVNLPATGLSMLGCIIFMIFGQVCYLLFLGYVTGVACKDWSNLGASEYSKEAAHLKSLFKKESTADKLNGSLKHHDDNWDYYNDLVSQHRSRNKS